MKTISINGVKKLPKLSAQSLSPRFQMTTQKAQTLSLEMSGVKRLGKIRNKAFVAFAQKSEPQSVPNVSPKNGAKITRLRFYCR
jgi:hypothetical protein